MLATDGWKILSLSVSAAIALTGCFANKGSGVSEITKTDSSSTSGTSSQSSAGTKVVKIVFSTSSTSGSFDAPLSSGTKAEYGQGHPAKRLFLPDSDASTIATGGPGGTGWPSWLKSVELGISGANNSAAQNELCARFAAGETATCAGANCAGPEGYYRVSEYDCLNCSGSTCPAGPPAASTGTGGSDDGVYVRVTFDRSALGSTENILVVLEYAASSILAAPANPASCASNGEFAPEGCSDQTWKVFLKHTSSENTSGNVTLKPFLLLLPPITGQKTVAKQFYLPLAADSSLTIMQISRIKSSANVTSLTASCVNNSPLCLGVVLYAMTLYRI